MSVRQCFRTRKINIDETKTAAVERYENFELEVNARAPAY